MTKLRVCIDPGHGCPPTPAGTMAGGLTERDYVLELARDVIRNSPAKWKYRLLRSKPKGLTYGERAVVAQAWCANLVICLHVNAFTDTRLKGMLVLSYDGDSIGQSVADVMGRCAPVGLLRSEGARSYVTSANNWTRRAHAVLGNYRAGVEKVPAVLVEVGFASHPWDLRILKSEKSRTAICAAIVAGVARCEEMRETF